jgi:hypothetical protein
MPKILAPFLGNAIFTICSTYHYKSGGDAVKYHDYDHKALKIHKTTEPVFILFLQLLLLLLLLLM